MNIKDFTWLSTSAEGMRKVQSSPCLLTSTFASPAPSISPPYNPHQSQSHVSRSSSCSSLSQHHMLHEMPLEENPIALVSSSVSQYVTCIETNGFPEDVFKNGTPDSKLNLMACLLSPDDPKEELRNLKPRPIETELESEIEMNSIQEVSEHFNRLLISIRKQRRSTRT